MALLQTNSSIFFSRPRCSSTLWLQAKLRISLVSFHEKMASSFTIAGSCGYEDVLRPLTVHSKFCKERYRCASDKMESLGQDSKHQVCSATNHRPHPWLVPTRAADPETQHELTQPKPTCPTCESLVRGCTVY